MHLTPRAERAPSDSARWLVVGVLLVAIAWLGLYIAFTHVYPNAAGSSSLYRYRDDALITLSHARGLIENGTVSVSVSGARVEGFSAPLQFVIAAVFYALGGTGFRTFFDSQILLSSAVLGAAVFLVLRFGASRGRERLAAPAALLVAIPLFGTYSFFSWHSSGMENSITNALTVASVAAVGIAVARGRGLVVAGTIVGLFALSRAEFIVHAAPLLVVGAFWLVRREHGWRSVARLVTPALVLWAAAQAVRVAYFGSLYPNTAEAQSISPIDHVEPWLRVMWPIALVAVVLVAALIGRRRVPRIRAVLEDASPLALKITVVAALTAACLVAWTLPGRPSVQPAIDAFHPLGFTWWIALIAGLGLLARRPFEVMPTLLAVQIATGFAHVLVFGWARLAPERVITFVLVPCVVLAALLAINLDAARVRAAVRGHLLYSPLAILAFVALARAGTGGWNDRHDFTTRSGVCCDVSSVVGRIEAVAAQYRDRTGGSVVNVAAADLGLLSWNKRFNITDEGWLGDPLLNRLWRRAGAQGRIGVAVGYLNHYAMPDVVELHDVWSCTYGDWWSSDAFKATYRQVQDDAYTTQWAQTNCQRPDGLAVPGGIWVRADLLADAPSPEATLTRRLGAHPNARLVRQALARCRTEQAWSCQFVTPRSTGICPHSNAQAR